MRAFLTASIALISSAALAQQTGAPPVGGTIGSPPPLPGPPSAAGPPVAAPPPAITAPDAAALPMVSRPDAGLDQVDADGVSTKSVRAVPCGTAARETDGTTTCVGIIPDRSVKRSRP